MVKVEILRLVGAAELLGVLAGRTAGQRLLEAFSLPQGAKYVVLDFEGITLITASAARESVLKLCALITQQGALPLLVNVNLSTLDELTFAAEAQKQPLVLAELTDGLDVQSSRILGSLEPTQQQTLQIVAALGEADAKAASEEAKSPAGATAWNNRLSNLASMRFLQERKVGKTKFYSLTIKGLEYGN